MASNNQKARKATGGEAPRVGPREIYTPPSSSDDVLVGPLFSSYPDIGAIVLRHLDPVDRSLFAGVSPSISDAVMVSENPSDASDRLPVAGVTPGIGLDAFTDSLEKFRYGLLTYPELLTAERTDTSLTVGLVCESAAAKGNLDVLREARAIGCPWGYFTAVKACRNGHLQVLQWARAPYQQWPMRLTRGCQYEAAIGGHSEVLQFLREERCEYDPRAANRAARSGNIRCLEILYETCIEQARERPAVRWYPDRVCLHAVDSGQIDVLKKAWALEPAVFLADINPFEAPRFNVFTMVQAVITGRMDMMKWLLDNGCPWGTYTCQYVAEQGDPAMLKWAAEAPNGCRCHSLQTAMSSTCSVHGDPLN